MLDPQVPNTSSPCFQMRTPVNDNAVIKSIQAANASTKAKIDTRPINFGVVLPGSIFRSSFPTEEDQEFLATLGLKTIL
jgi:tyrosine-protein phosphatase SIW14